MVPVSLTMIVRDEEKNLRACVEPVRDLFGEMVILDTGSLDDTKRIAHDLGARTCSISWLNDFSLARNAAIDLAELPWIFWLDADDRVDAENVEKLRKLFESLPEDPKEATGYIAKVRCTLPMVGGSSMVMNADHVRLFPRRPDLRWRYRCHEQVLAPIHEIGGRIVWTDIRIDHVGYTDPETTKRKARRNLPLIEADGRERPGDPQVLYTLGHALADANRFDEAISTLKESLRLSTHQSCLRARTCALLLQLEWDVGGKGNVCMLDHVEEGKRLDYHPEVLFIVGVILHEIGKLPEAEEILRKIVDTVEWPVEIGSYDDSVTSHKAKHRLAKVLTDTGEHEEARELLLSVLEAQPGYNVARFDLCKLAIKSKDAAEAERLISWFMDSGSMVDACYLSGLLCRSQGEHDRARVLFERTLGLNKTHAGALRELEAIK